MSSVKSVLQSRSTNGGHAIEVDVQLEDGSKQTIEMPYERIPMIVHAITSAATVAEAAQKSAPGGLLTAVIVPYRVTDTRTGAAVDGSVVVVDFVTSQGPFQFAMTPALARLTSERISIQLASLDRQPPQKLS